MGNHDSYSDMHDYSSVGNIYRPILKIISVVNSAADSAHLPRQTA
jgi:hypothetical protein